MAPRCSTCLTRTRAACGLSSPSPNRYGSDTISFNFRDDPAYIALDNVSVVQAGGTTTTGTTPEPSSFILMGSGVLAGRQRWAELGSLKLAR